MAGARAGSKSSNLSTRDVLFHSLLLIVISFAVKPFAAKARPRKPLPKEPAKAGGPGIDPRKVTNTKAGLFVLLLFQLKL